MNREQFHSQLENVGVPVRYGFGEEGLKLPFIYYTFVRQSMIDADNRTYATKNDVELHVEATSKKELDEVCLKVESVLSENDIPFGSPQEGWDNKERIYLNTYYLEV